MRARGAFPWREACSSRCIIMLRCCTVGVSHLLPLWRLSSGNIVILGKRKPQGLSSNRKALVQGRNQGMHTGPRAASWHLHQAMGTEPQPRTKHAPENNHQRHCFLRFFRTTTPLGHTASWPDRRCKLLLGAGLCGELALVVADHVCCIR